MSEKDKRTQWKGDVLDYYALIENPSVEREDLYCLTFQQTKALISAIDLYRYITRWEFGAIDAHEVEIFVNDAQRRLMMPCGSDNIIVMSRWTPEGHYQESSDSGETWVDAPQHDPRNNVTIPPPFLPDGTIEPDCTYADSIVNNMINAWINATGDGEDLANVIAGILGFLAGLLGAFGAVVATIVLGIGSSIVAGTVAAWKEAWTTEVWDRFRCNLHDNMSADGSFTQENVDAIYSRIGDEETGIVLISLQRMVAAVGWQGLTIAARYGYGSPEADCSCEEPSGVWFVNNSAGTTEIFPDAFGVFTVECDDFASGGYYGNVQFMENVEVPFEPCHSLTVVSSTGGATLSTILDCHTGASNPLSSCAVLVQFFSSTPWTVTFTIGDNCE